MSGAATILILAAFGQVILTMWAIVTMGLARVACVRRGEVKIAQVALSDRDWPEPIQKLQANTRNQFETPVLFFAAVAIALATGGASWLAALAALCYLASRVAHRVIHVGSNSVVPRFYAFVAGLVALGILWIAALVGALFS